LNYNKKRDKIEKPFKDKQIKIEKILKTSFLSVANIKMSSQVIYK